MKHERELAEDARAQARLGDAYVELLSIVNRTAHFADLVRPIFDTDPPTPPPPLPPPEEQMRAEALVMAYGSRAVEDLFEAWRQSVWNIIRADREIGIALEMRGQRSQSGIDYLETWRKLTDELRPAQKAARKALSEAIGVELRSRPPTQATLATLATPTPEGSTARGAGSPETPAEA
jgi:hypothetical protein